MYIIFDDGENLSTCVLSENLIKGGGGGETHVLSLIKNLKSRIKGGGEAEKNRERETRKKIDLVCVAGRLPTRYSVGLRKFLIYIVSREERERKKKQ